MSVYNAHSVSENEYDEFLRFINEHADISYDKLDGCFSNSFNLFNVPRDERFRLIEERLDKIILTLPAIKRIFSKPIIHLKDEHEIVPTEAVRVINNYTLTHAMTHSELWDKTESGSIKPTKLMTVEKIENYVTYENLIFCKAVNMILSFVRKTTLILKDILYGSRELNFNLFDRTQHNSYFLALGKLRKGYSDVSNQYSNSYEACVKKIFLIDKTVRSKLGSKVYLKCNGISKDLPLKKTNAFRSHKDYRAIYNLLTFFQTDITAQDTENILDAACDTDKYKAYCTLLSLFAVLHFNFSVQGKEPVNLQNLREKFTFLGWSLTLQSLKIDEISALRFSVKKDTEYSICLLISEKSDLNESALERFKCSVYADEYLFAGREAYGACDTLYLCLYDIDSFRRIQQIILRGMIYSDKTQDECAFCGNKTVKTENGCECRICRAKITEKVCEKTSESYYVSEIVKYKSVLGGSRSSGASADFLHDRRVEAQMHFRNITDITPEGGIICPRCGRTHT